MRLTYIALLKNRQFFLQYGVSGRYYLLEDNDDLGASWLPKGAIVSGANTAVIKLDVDAGKAIDRFERFLSQNIEGS